MADLEQRASSQAHTLGREAGLERSGRAILIALALGGVLLSLLYARGLLLYGHDASYYLMMANSLASGEGLQAQTLRGASSNRLYPITVWPPGFPVLVAPFILAGVESAWASAIVTHLSLFLVVFLTGYLAAGAFGWRVGLLAATLAALQPKLWALASSGASELPFIVLTLLCVLSLRLRQPARFAALTLCIAGAIYVRYTGVYLIPFLLAVSLIPRLRAYLSLREAVAVVVAAAAVIAPLAARNFLISGHLSGADRSASDKGLLTNIVEAGVAVVDGFVPLRVTTVILANGYLKLGVGLGVIAALAAATWWILRTRRQDTAQAGTPLFVWLALASSIYFFVIAVLRSTSQFDDLNYRLLAPVIPFVLVLLAYVGMSLYNSHWRICAGLGAAAYIGVAVLYLFAGPPLTGKPVLPPAVDWVQHHLPETECVVSADALVLAPLLDQYRVVLPPELPARSTKAQREAALRSWGQDTGCSYALAIARYAERGSRRLGQKTFLPEATGIGGGIDVEGLNE